MTIDAFGRELPAPAPLTSAAWWSRPTLPAELAIALGWGVLVWQSVAGSGAPASSGAMGGMAGMGGSGAPSATDGLAGMSAHAVHASSSTLVMAVAMAAAMMLPGALPALRHVSENTFRRHRVRATALFGLIFGAVWAVFGLAAMEIAGQFSGSTQRALFVAALVGAALWERTQRKWAAIQDCHRSWPLPPHGWPATRGVAVFALRHAGACVRACWALMLVASLAPSASLLWMAGVTAIITVEKLTPRPRRAANRSALALAFVGAVTAAIVA